MNAELQDFGRLVSAEELAEGLFRGLVSAKWITRNVKIGKVHLGHVKVAFYEKVVALWLQSLALNQREE